MSNKKYETLLDRTRDILTPMEVGDSLYKPDIITALYGDWDYFKARSFDVYFCGIKKELKDRVYKTINKHIVRIS